MRQAPANWIKDLRVQWLCAAVEAYLGERDLSRVPALMSGFGSVLDHVAPTGFAEAAFALRQLGLVASSEIALRQAVHDALSWEEDNRDRPDYVEPPFRIHADREGYPFERRPGTDVQVREMLAALAGGLPLDAWTIPTADPARPMTVVPPQGAEGADVIGIDISVLAPPPVAPRHDLSRPPRGPIVVPLSDLERIAQAMDARDAAVPGRPRGNWAARLREADGGRKFHVLAPDRGAGVLRETDAIRLEGLRHLIGLPGTGKTTLIVLLLMWLDEQGYRVTVLLPSIEASLNLLADLRFYEADVGLLVGQSPQTRLDHARKFAERVGADEARGFGRSAPGADLLGLNCALGAFDTDPEGHDGFPHLAPPCRDVRQKGLKQDGSERKEASKHLCPLGGGCGRLKAPRELTGRRIWLGHVLSLDTRIGPHFASEVVRYYEAVAMASDLVIVDEADGAQAALDRKAIASLDLTGSEESYEHALNRDLFTPISAGRTDITASNVQSYTATAADFAKMNRSLVTMLQRHAKREAGQGPISAFKDTFVTGNSVLNALFCPEDITRLPPTERLAEERRFNALNVFWDGVVRAALFRRSVRDLDADEHDYEPARVAAELSVSEAAVSATGAALSNLIRDWIAEPLPATRDEILAEACKEMFALVPPRAGLAQPHAVDLFRFLIGVATVVMQFLTLVPAQQAMVAEGVHSEPLFRQGISEDLARVVPEALIGRLSGLRFQVEEAGARPSVRLQYVTFRGAPRALLYRLHQLLRHEGRDAGPAVLLASATSFLTESPTFHIPTGPDLVLRRAGADLGWRDSRYVFAPPPDPADPTRRLRFSGAPLAQRERILRQMVDHYFAGDDPLALRMTQDFDPGRKVGFVVNSYAQVRQFKEHLRRTRPELDGRVIGIVGDPPPGNEGDWATAAQVERLGGRDDWDCVVFPMKALARGVNIVFDDGPRRRDALIGTLVFMTRPHPAAESLDLVAGLAGAGTLAFDRRSFPPSAGPAQMAWEWRQARSQLLATTRRLLRFPPQASRLGDLAEPFTADIMVDVLQCIGRAMRNGCKARVIFADAAWAPNSAGGKRDTADSSMLVRMRDILRARLADPDPVDREVYRALYEPFLHPIERCANLIFPDGADDLDDAA